MSKLQPQVNGLLILTEGQVRDILNGGHLNNLEFLPGIFSKIDPAVNLWNNTNLLTQNDLDAIKELLHYVNSTIIEKPEQVQAKLPKDLFARLNY